MGYKDIGRTKNHETARNLYNEEAQSLTYYFPCYREIDAVERRTQMRVSDEKMYRCK